jgi:hypothetical protein
MDASTLFPLIVLITLAYAILAWIRRRHARGAAATWPLTEGKIETLQIERRGHDVPADVAAVGYSYKVNGSWYSGATEIPRVWWKSAPTSALIGSKIQIRANPRNPSESAAVSASLPDLDHFGCPALLVSGANR